jgi:hypothetical protein
MAEQPPTCQVCGRELQLFVQLELSSLPEECALPTRDGVLQLFYCRGDDPCSGNEESEPFSNESKLARVVPKAGLSPVAASGSGEPPWPPQVIVGWERFADRPDSADHAAEGLRTSFDYVTERVLVQADEVGVAEHFERDAFSVSDISSAAAGDKLAGWPCWVQGADYVRCYLCGDQMQVVFQLDSHNHLPHSFGSLGIGHISMCRSHPDVAAFGFASG